MLSVRFLNRFNILSDFCFGWHEIATPSRSQCHLLLTQPRALPSGPGSGLGPFWRGPPLGRGATRWARLSRGGHENVFRKPRRQWEWTKEFQGNSIYSRVRSKLQALLKMCRYSDIPKSCPHIACTVPPTPDTVHSHFSTFQEHLT